MNKYTKTHHDWKYMTKEEFIEKSISVWGDIYSYEHTKIYRATTPVIITCKKHGNFEQIISNHLRGHNGCVACRCEKSETDYNSLMKKFKELHGDKYDYSLITEKIPMSKIIDIICPVHGVFKQRGCKHISGKQGCPHCQNVTNESRGSKKIKKYLQSINIPFVPEFRFDDCKNKNKLPFDFKITIDHKLALIEFNGEQHFKESGWQPLEYIQTNDKIKRDYCKSKNIHLLDINYNEEHLIPEKINTFISMLKGDK